MSKKLLSFFLASVMIISCSSLVFGDAGSSNFTKRYEYGDEVFTDVQSKDWFYENVGSVYEYGLMNGKGQNRFDPQGNVTIAETLTIAARLNSIYKTGDDTFEKSNPWYQVYADYCKTNGIVSELPAEINVAATRGQFASILASALPDSELPQKNNVLDDTIPDVSSDSEFADAVYKLYRAGITVGSDSKGTFNPQNNIKRSEVAAIVTRMIDPSLRQSVSLSTYKIYVSPDGNDTTGDGSISTPFATIEKARDTVRNLNKAELSGIDVIIKSGVYTLSSPIELTSADSGTEACTIRYIGEGNSTIVGGVALSASDFSKATGNATQYFPDDVKDKIVQIDLTTIGFTKDYLNNIMSQWSFIDKLPRLAVNGEFQTIARYPNDDYINIVSGFIEGGESYASDNVSPTTINYGEEHFDRVHSWHDISSIRVYGRYSVLWASDNTEIWSFDDKEPIMIVPFSGGHDPVPGGLLFWYNIPEELDAPGEFYIDSDAILYYYPTDAFTTATLSIPLIDSLITLDSTDHVTFENLKFESANVYGITGKGDFVTVKDCELSSIIAEAAISLKGNNILIQGNHVFYVGRNGIAVETGDLPSLTKGNSVIYNNVLHDWGLYTTPYAKGINPTGCGITSSHNYLYNSNGEAFGGGGAYNVQEYNYVHDVLRNSDDLGAFSGNTGFVGNVVRYNCIYNVGSVGAAAEAENLHKMGSAAIYWDGGGSYAEAYGNVIETVRGHGFILNGGRGLQIHGNLIIDCTMWYAQVVGTFYARALERDTYSGTTSDYPDFVHNEAYKQANPELDLIVTDLSLTTPDDPYGWAAPAGDLVLNNWSHFNKYNRAFSNWGVRPHYIEDCVFKFSGDNIDVKKDGTDDHTSSYNSRREKVDLKDLITNVAAGVIEIDWDTFGQIGIVDADWNLDFEYQTINEFVENR